MYEGSYHGFTQWATAKNMPKGLKAMVRSEPAAPGWMYRCGKGVGTCHGAPNKW